MTYLLDVNVLVAWGWSDHVDHERTAAWIGAARRKKATKLLTSAIPELGMRHASWTRTTLPWPRLPVLGIRLLTSDVGACDRVSTHTSPG